MMNIDSGIKQRTRRVLFGFIACCFMLYSASLPVLASPLSKSELQALNEWTNWVASQCSATNTASTPSSDGVAPGPIYIMGDSVTQAAQPTYLSTLQGAGWTPTVAGLDGRQIEGGPSPDGLAQIKSDKAAIGSANAIIVALGSNDVTDPPDTTKARVQKTMAKIVELDTQKAPIFWINVLDTKHDAASKKTNKAIADGVGGAGTVIDWYSTAQKSADLSSFSNGINPTKPQDIDLLVNLVRDTLTGFQGPSPTGSGSLTYTTAGNIPAGGEDVGASDFTDAQGWKGDSLAGTYSYAELGGTTEDTATDLGHLPYKQKLAITYKGKTVVAEKLDIGLGGGPVGGHQREIDLHVDKTAQALGFNNGLDVVHIQAVADTTPLGPTDAQGTPGGSGSDSGSNNCQCQASTTFGPGTLPAYVKDPYNSIFTAAGSKFNVDPGVLVGIFYDEQYGYNSAVSSFNKHLWPDPPPPYGHGAKWSLNYGDNGSGTWPDGTVGARGPFQFEPGTWQGQGGSKGYGVDGNGDGKKDPTDLTDEAFGAANYLAALGATNPESQSKIEHAATGYSGGYPTYSQAAFTIYQKIKADEGGGSPPPSTPGPAGTGSSCDQSATGSPNCTSATGNTKIICEAQQYKGIYYLWGGGHSGYPVFRQNCPLTSISSAAQSSTAGNPGPCATDCSGLVSVAVDAAFGQKFDWDVGALESDSSNWKSINISQVQPGDVVTVGSGHVEIVDHVSGGKITTFGSHAPGEQTGPVSPPTSYWTGAYRYIGPGSGS